MDNAAFKHELNMAFAELIKYANGRDFDEERVRKFLHKLAWLFPAYRLGRRKRTGHRCSLCPTEIVSEARWQKGCRICSRCSRSLKRKKTA